MMTTPFGSAVAPDVKMISAVSSAVSAGVQIWLAPFPGTAWVRMLKSRAAERDRSSLSGQTGQSASGAVSTTSPARIARERDDLGDTAEEGG